MASGSRTSRTGPEDTEEGQLSLVRANGDDAHPLGVDGDAPDWSPDGKQLVYVHEGSLWVVDPTEPNAHRLVPDGHAPAYSRDGEQIAFRRTEKCSRNSAPSI